MTRLLALALAVAAGLCAALLLASAPTVHVGGETRTCPGVIAGSEDGAPGLGMGANRVERACEDRQRDWTALAGLAALVALVAGSGAAFAGRAAGDEAELRDETVARSSI